MRPRARSVVRTLSLFSLLCFSLTPLSHAAQWRSLGPEGGAVHALAAAPGSGRVYALTSRGGQYVSTDGAANWSSAGANSLFIDSLIVAPSRPEVLYGLTFLGNSLVKSVDGGVTWSAPLLTGNLCAAQVDPSDSDVLYASRSTQEILKSTDGGVSWTSIPYGGTATCALAVDPSNPLVVYAADFNNGVYRSDDGGATWALQASLVLSELVIDPRQPATLYGLSRDTVYKSTDRGATWASLWTVPAGLSITPQHLTLDPESGTLYMLDRQAGVFRSTDGGASWALTLSLPGVRDLALDGLTPGRVYAGTDADGAYRSDDRGGTWTLANHGLRDLGFVAVAADPHTSGVLLAVANPNPGAALDFSPQFLLRSTDGGATWSVPFGSGRPDESPFVTSVAADPFHAGTWYLATAGGLLKSVDGGRSWQAIDQGIRRFDFLYNLALSPSSPDVLYSTGWGSFPVCGPGPCARVITYRTVDGGAQWQRAPVPGLQFGDLLLAMAVDARNPSVVYVGGPHVYKSTNGGASWSQTTGNLRGTIESLAADPSTSGTLYAAVYVPRGRRVYKTTNGGATWTPASGGLSPDALVLQIVPDPHALGTLYAATSQGVYLTRNGGALWTPLPGGSGGFAFFLAPDPLHPGVLYVGREDGLFEYSSGPAAVR